MLRDARRAIGSSDTRFAFRAFDCRKIPCKDESFDLVIANHVLFYCDDIPSVLKEVRRVLAPGGNFSAVLTERHICRRSASWYRILMNGSCFPQTGFMSGSDAKTARVSWRLFFPKAQWLSYEDCLLVQDAEPLISYVLSCHGNQNQYILDRYKEFRAYTARKTAKGFRITKDAAYFFVKNSQK